MYINYITEGITLLVPTTKFKHKTKHPQLGVYFSSLKNKSSQLNLEFFLVFY